MRSRLSRLQWAGVVSLGLHAAALGGWVVWHGTWHPWPQAISDPAAGNGAIELVMLEQKGTDPNPVPPTPSPTVTPEPPPPPDPAPAAIAAPPPPPLVPAPEPETEDLPAPPLPSVATALATVPPPPVPDPTPPDEPRQAPLRIDLRGNNTDSNTIVLPAPQVIPASVNSKFRNKEPVYPMEAQRRAEQGAVLLLIHVAPDGLPAGVDVTSSSGYPVLDRAATDAVWKWHFLPATQGGQPVAFDMRFRIVFQLE